MSKLKWYCLSIILVSLFSSCKQGNNKDTIVSNTIDTLKEMHVHKVASPLEADNFPQFVFKSDYTDKGYNSDSLTKIVIYNKGVVVQMLDNLHAFPGQNKIYLEDINFDGYPDLALDTQWLARGGIYKYWLYNADKEKFEPTNIMDSIYYSCDDKEIDYKNKTITITQPNGYNSYLTEIYRWEDNKYSLVESGTFEIINKKNYAR